MRMLIALGLAAVLTTGCASGGASAASHPPSGARYDITPQELANNADRSLYEVLQELHPLFLRSQDYSSAHQPVDVYVDGARTEGLEELRQLRASTVQSVHFYEPSEANLRFGNGHNGGLIAVTLKR